jgi:hypothetical protein
VLRHLVVSSYVLVYRSPSNRTSENSDNLCSLISEATNKGYSHILIMGDFNYPDIDWEKFDFSDSYDVWFTISSSSNEFRHFIK